MPNQPKTKNRVVRVPDELWDAARATATSRGEVLSEVMRESLRRYVEDERARAYMERSEAAQPTTWCIECGGPSDVLEEGCETSPDGRDFWVRRLDCGHEESAPR